MKRSNYEMELGSLDIAKSLMLLSQRVEITNNNYEKTIMQGEIFQCKTCNKRFSSFQALGGHRASHKRPRVAEDEKGMDRAKLFLSVGVKPKVHECAICGLRFATGQALGGHMRRHRADLGDHNGSSSTFIGQPVSKLPVLKRSSSCNKRVMGLDLNLTPLENDLRFLFGKMAPKVDPYIC